MFRDEQNKVIDHCRFPNDLPEILAPLAPYQEKIQGRGGVIYLQLVLVRRWVDGGRLSGASG